MVGCIRLEIHLHAAHASGDVFADENEVAGEGRPGPLAFIEHPKRRLVDALRVANPPGVDIRRDAGFKWRLQPGIEDKIALDLCKEGNGHSWGRVAKLLGVTAAEVAKWV